MTANCKIILCIYINVYTAKTKAPILIPTVLNVENPSARARRSSVAGTRIQRRAGMQQQQQGSASRAGVERFVIIKGL